MSVEPKTILAIKLRELGDTVLFSSSLSALKDRFPNAQIDVLVPDGGKAILKGHPAVRNIYGTSKRLPALALSLWKLSVHRYDLALGFHATSSLVRAIGFLKAKEKLLHHYSKNEQLKGNLVTIDKPAELIDALSRDLKILRALGWNAEPSAPKIYLTQEEREKALALLPPDHGLKRLAVLPGARLLTHRYPKDLWFQVVDDLKDDRKFSPVVLVDSALSSQWKLPEWCKKRNIPLLDKLSLRELLAVLSHCDTALGNDSGPIHMSTALGLKTLTLFGPGCAGDYHPYELKDHPMLRVEIECRKEGPRGTLFSYCTVKYCDHMRCLRTIPPEVVVKRISELHDRGTHVH